jgi:hypothetical protein
LTGRLGTAARQVGLAGQAMIEYALIMATVVMSFALASNIGVTKSVAARLSENQEAYSIRLPDKFTAAEIGKRAQQFNDQISLK